MTRSGTNWLIYRPYIVYDGEEGDIGLSDDAPEEARRAWEDDRNAA